MESLNRDILRKRVGTNKLIYRVASSQLLVIKEILIQIFYLTNMQDFTILQESQACLNSYSAGLFRGDWCCSNSCLTFPSYKTSSLISKSTRSSFLRGCLITSGSVQQSFCFTPIGDGHRGVEKGRYPGALKRSWPRDGILEASILRVVHT